VGEIPFPVPAEWPPTADLSQCCVCMETYATVFSFPCGHIAMCEQCTGLVQERHLIQLETKFRRNRGAGIEVTPPPCILCRTPMTGNLLLTRMLGPHPLLGRSLPSSRRHSLAGTTTGAVAQGAPEVASRTATPRQEGVPPPRAADHTTTPLIPMAETPRVDGGHRRHSPEMAPTSPPRTEEPPAPCPPPCIPGEDTVNAL